MLHLVFGSYGCDPLLGHGSIAGGHPVGGTVKGVEVVGGGGVGGSDSLRQGCYMLGHVSRDDEVINVC